MASLTWFLAIGSVMNPTALRLRGVEIHDTRAAVVHKGVRRAFYGKRGMASLVLDPNATALHSVVHLLDAEGVAILDAIEVGYEKVFLDAELLPRFGATVSLSEATTVNVFSYAMTRERIKTVGVDGVTSRRYLDLLVEGLEIAGGHPEEVARLDVIPSRPRKPASQMVSIPDAAAVVLRDFTAAEVHASATGPSSKDEEALQDSQLLFVFDQRVIRRKKGAEGGMWWRSIKKLAGTDITLRLCQIYLEPRLSPPPWSREHLTPAYIAFVEDVASRGPYQDFEVVGRLAQGEKVHDAPGTRSVIPPKPSPFSSLAQFHCRGFVELSRVAGGSASVSAGAAAAAATAGDAGARGTGSQRQLALPPAVVETLRSKVLRVYERRLGDARQRGWTETDTHGREYLRPGCEEKLEGFLGRQGGRVDMTNLEESDLDLDALLPRDQRFWLPFVKSVLGEDMRCTMRGCVVSRPGDAAQNWHIDGVHRDPLQHQAADRLNVFVPLVDLSSENGGTEMVERSHVRRPLRQSLDAENAEKGGPGGQRRSPKYSSKFEAGGYDSLQRVTPLPRAGEATVMDYRLWHRGLANKVGGEKIRPLLYFTYSSRTTWGKKARAAGGRPVKRRRIALL